MTQMVEQPAEDSPFSWFWRMFVVLEAWARPAWGWGVLISCMLLTMLPAVALRANHLLALGAYQQTLEATGPLAVMAVWWLWGWRRQARQHLSWLAPLWLFLIGALLLSQLLLGWLPGPRVLWQSVNTGNWLQVPEFMLSAWLRAGTRFALWGQGVASGGAAQDNLVFATCGAVILWILGVATAWLARGLRQGFAAGAPSLWLLGLILLYSPGGRYLLLSGLALTLALQILLDQEVLTQHWQRLRLDFSPGLVVDRLVAVLGAGAIILTLAAVMPNLYIQPLVDRYYAVLAPMHLAMEDFGERLFPDLRGTSRLRGGGDGGLPNEFLLRGGPELGSAPVMRVRTDEAAAYAGYPFDESPPPPGHYMRGRTLTVYDGRGWSNPSGLVQTEIAANQRWEGQSTWGRKQVVQSVILDVRSTTLFAAPEPVEASADVRLETRGADDLVAVQARESSYTVISMVPAVNEEMLRELPAWSTAGDVAAGEQSLPLPEALQAHLQLPDTITDRTRELAHRLVDGQPTSYDKALAIEQYLRQYTYDLDVDEPPSDVTDVADYFLFDLQRGYCDYYATAFVVLARLAGLPTRFATGFAVGQWNPIDGVFVVTESEAHSWPEVYFPQAGWIPFEPTAGRAQLLRIALPESKGSVLPPPIVTPTAADNEREQAWDWQRLLWLVPLAAVVWLVWQGWTWWLRRREDPWQAVLQWGSRAGRPMGDGETVLEYGEGLSGYVLNHQHQAQDAGRIVAREIEAVSAEVNRLHYGLERDRGAARNALAAHWERLRVYLRLVRFR